MGPQDGVDIVARARPTSSCTSMGRDRHLASRFMGAGDCFDELVALRDELGLAGLRRVPGPGARTSPSPTSVDRRRRAVARPEEPAQRRVDDEQDDGVHGVRAAGGGLRPAGDPGVGAGARARTSSPTTSTRYAEAIVELLDDPSLRAEMGRRGRERVEQELAWSHQQGAYLSVFNELVERTIELPATW